MPGPALLRGDGIYVPMEFLFTPVFSEWTGYHANHDPQTQILTLEKRSNLGSPRFFSYPDRTRVILEIQSELSYRLARKGPTQLDLLIPGGVPLKADSWRVQDGILRELRISGDRRLARVG